MGLGGFGLDEGGEVVWVSSTSLIEIDIRVFVAINFSATLFACETWRLDNLSLDGPTALVLLNIDTLQNSWCFLFQYCPGQDFSDVVLD